MNPVFIAAVNQSVKDLFPTVYGEGLATISRKTVKDGKLREHGRALTLAEMRLLEEKVPDSDTLGGCDNYCATSWRPHIYPFWMGACGYQYAALHQVCCRFVCADSPAYVCAEHGLGRFTLH